VGMRCGYVIFCESRKRKNKNFELLKLRFELCKKRTASMLAPNAAAV
jgi:hypothetical protein